MTDMDKMMIEKVARAICCHNGCAASDAPNSDFTVCQAPTYEADARAAIAASDLNEQIEDYCRAVLAGNSPRHDEPFETIGKAIRAATIRAARVTAYNPDDRLREALEELRGEITRAFGVINPQRRLGKALAKAESALSPLPQALK